MERGIGRSISRLVSDRGRGTKSPPSPHPVKLDPFIATHDYTVILTAQLWGQNQCKHAKGFTGSINCKCPPWVTEHTARQSLIPHLAEINDVILSVSRPVCYFESLIDALFVDACVVRRVAVCAREARASVYVYVYVCACADGAPSQLERESGKGAISAQLALIASTLFWWAAALCEMTKCWVPDLLLRPLHHRCCCWYSQADSCSQREGEEAARAWI